MADFNKLLLRLGFNHATIAHLDAQSIRRMEDLMNLRVSEVSEMIDLNGKFKESYVEASRRNPTDSVTFTYLAAKRIKALHLWGEYKKLRGEDADVSTHSDTMSTRRRKDSPSPRVDILRRTGIVWDGGTTHASKGCIRSAINSYSICASAPDH